MAADGAPRACVDDRVPVAGLPARAGIGFKPQHVDDLLADPEPPAFVEIHAENHLGAGGRPWAQLQAVAARLPLSVHGVGLSIGSDAPLDARHLDRVAALLARVPAATFSEHLAWSTHAGHFFADLLPVCYDAAALDRVCRHVDAVQARLGRRILLENPSSYLAYAASTIDEAAFIARIVERTGCGLLLDVNNAYVSAHNLGRDVQAYLDALPLYAVGEVHLAGHAIDEAEAPALLIDDHGAAVGDAVWALYARVVARIGAVPTLIEWDTRVPDYATLRAEARRAQALLDAHARREATP